MSETQVVPRNILQRLSAVMAQVEYIKKEKSVSTGGEGSYKAVTHDQVAGMVRGEFVKQGIVIVPNLVEHTMTDTGQVTAKGAKTIRVEAVYDVRFLSVDDSNSNIGVRVLAHGIDTGDKAPGKVLSYAVKYAILKVLMIETGESDESRYGGEDEVDKIVALNNAMRDAATIQDLRDRTKEALVAVQDDPKQTVIFTNLGVELAKKFPSVKMPTAKTDPPAATSSQVSSGPSEEGAEGSAATKSSPPAASTGEKPSAGLIKSVKSLAEAKGYALPKGWPAADLDKQGAAMLLKTITEYKPETASA